MAVSGKKVIDVGVEMSCTVVGGAKDDGPLSEGTEFAHPLRPRAEPLPTGDWQVHGPVVSGVASVVNNTQTGSEVGESVGGAGESAAGAAFVAWADEAGALRVTRILTYCRKHRTTTL